jgi:hypothetical protein
MQLGDKHRECDVQLNMCMRVLMGKDVGGVVVHYLMVLRHLAIT